MCSQARKVVIVGSGPAGLTSAIYTARAQLNPLVIEGAMPGGQLTTTTKIENFPGFPGGIFGSELMSKMREQAIEFGSEVVNTSILGIKLDERPFCISLSNGSEVRANAVIFATGASPRMLDLEGEKDLLGYGLSTCATCDGAFCKDQDIAVVGGGDSACEEALFLTRFAATVSMIHRRDTLRASKIMVERVLQHPKIKVIWNSKVVELLGDRQDGLLGCVLESVDSASESRGATSRFELRCSSIFYAIGHRPNSELLRGWVDLDENGYVITEPQCTETKISGVFACGDLVDRTYRQAITAAGSGCMAAIDVERFLSSLSV